MKREKYFKTGIGREFIKNIIENYKGTITFETETTKKLISNHFLNNC